MSLLNKETHLHQFHVANGKTVSFAGFEMAVWYKGVIPEHLAVRNSVGVFDVSHMGRVVISGVDSEAYLNHVTTNDVSALEPLSAQYSLMCNEDGGIKDDFILSRQEPEKFFMVYNAANRNKNFAWLTKQAAGFKVALKDVSNDVAMFAVQGPKSRETLEKAGCKDLDRIERFKCGWTQLAGATAFASRTGYTGEDGFEVFIWDSPVSSPEKAVKAWNSILEAGRDFNIEPCGLGARDTLRLEAGMCLYGNDIDENTSPLEARLRFVVKLRKEEFIGREALLKQKAEGVVKKRVGLRMVEGTRSRGKIPRPKHEVYKQDERIGIVTSGTYSPLLEKGVAMAYVQAEHAVVGEPVDIMIRGWKARAEIAKFPLYDAAKYGQARKL